MGLSETHLFILVNTKEQGAGAAPSVKGRNVDGESCLGNEEGVLKLHIPKQNREVGLHSDPAGRNRNFFY